jgi:hypothetical protein
MLSDRLRNPKFAGPENPQTGIAAKWEPIGNTMGGLTCRLISGMYLSGREAQLIHNTTERARVGILQAGVRVRAGEDYEVEMWARAQHRPVTLSVGLRQAGRRAPEGSKAEMIFDLAHWHRRACRITAPGDGDAFFEITIPGDSRVIVDQVHLRPASQGHVSQELLDALKQLPCPVLRFPRRLASPAPTTGSTGSDLFTCARSSTTRSSNTRYTMTSARTSIWISVLPTRSAPFSPSTQPRQHPNRLLHGPAMSAIGTSAGGSRYPPPTSCSATKTTAPTRLGT